MVKDKVKEIDRKQLAELIERIEYAIENNLALSVDDMKLLLSAIITLCTLQQRLEDDQITLHKLRKLLGMVRQSESRKKQNNNSDIKKRKNNTTTKNNNKKPKTKPIVVHHKITEYASGQICPECNTGKLYKFEPATLLRITGHAPYEAKNHITEQLRCNACTNIFKASLPTEVLDDGGPNQKYGYSARTLMVINKFYSGLPYYHQGNLSDTFGCSISASTIFDQCEHVANDIMAVFYELRRQAANVQLYLLDDTHNRILEQKPELRPKRKGKGYQLRTGIYSSGLIAMTSDQHEIVIFKTSLGHAGEHLDEILSLRNKGLPIPITMSDALSSNAPVVSEVKQAYCNAHSRRQFMELEAQRPKKVKFILDLYDIIWKTENKCKEIELTPEKRLKCHQEHSLPAMNKLRDFCISEENSAAFEEHSAWGRAIKYFLRNFEKLTLFCILSGVPIDNNRMEETLKLLIRCRKTAHFYKTTIGAEVANVLTSIIATTHRAGINIYHYITTLQKNKTEVKEDPADWMPWNYQDKLSEIIKEAA